MSGKFNEKYPPGDSPRHGLKTYICGLKSGILRVGTLVFILLSFTSCFEKGDCLVTNSTLIRVSLKKVNKADTTLTFVSVKLPTGEEIYANKSLAALELPVDPGKPSTSFYFERAGFKDTLTFAYRNEAIVISPDCGAFEFQKDVSVTHNTFGRDSVRWLTNQLSKNVTVNVEVYF